MRESRKQTISGTDESTASGHDVPSDADQIMAIREQPRDNIGSDQPVSANYDNTHLPQTPEAASLSF